VEPKVVSDQSSSNINGIDKEEIHLSKKKNFLLLFFR